MKQKFTSLVLIILVTFMSISLTSCGDNQSDISQSSQDSSSNVTIIDRSGKEIPLPEKLDKIISASASNTEILVELGLKDKIIGADTFSSDAGIDPNLATIDMMNINVEQILTLKPDVILINGISMTGAENPYAALEDAGVTVVYIPSAISLQDIKDDITFISKYTGTELAGEKIVKEMDAEIARIKAIGEKIVDKKSVYLEVSSAPYCYSMGKDTYLNEILNIIGADNILADESGWISVSEENIISKNPNFILSTVAFDGYDMSEISKRPGWDVVDAVKNQKVFAINPNNASRASQNVVKAMDEISKIIYPEVYN